MKHIYLTDNCLIRGQLFTWKLSLLYHLKSNIDDISAIYPRIFKLMKVVEFI